MCVLKTFPRVTDYFNVKVYFSNACLNSAEHIISLNKILEEQMRDFKFLDNATTAFLRYYHFTLTRQ